MTRHPSRADLAAAVVAFVAVFYLVVRCVAYLKEVLL